MKIASCEKYKGNTYCIILGNNQRFYLDIQIIYDFQLKAGNDYDVDLLNEAIHQNDLRKANKRAMYLVADRDYGYNELIDKLSKNYDEYICVTVADKMVEYGYVDDNRYAKKLADYLIKTKRIGISVAKYEMLKKKLDKTLVENILSEYDIIEIRDNITAIIRKKYSDSFTDSRSAKKAIDALMRKGYRFNDIKWCVDRYINCEYESED